MSYASAILSYRHTGHGDMYKVYGFGKKLWTNPGPEYATKMDRHVCYHRLCIINF
jgi:hypothetical protein